MVMGRNEKKVFFFFKKKLPESYHKTYCFVVLALPFLSPHCKQTGNCIYYLCYLCAGKGCLYFARQKTSEESFSSHTTWKLQPFKKLLHLTQLQATYYIQFIKFTKLITCLQQKSHLQEINVAQLQQYFLQLVANQKSHVI